MSEYLCIAPDVKLGQNVKLSKFINLYGCEIGDTKIGAFVEIQKGARIGKNSIGENAIAGAGKPGTGVASHRGASAIRAGRRVGATCVTKRAAWALVCPNTYMIRIEAACDSKAHYHAE
jgi:UDP-3-O-[3-hydroxymyristoyl] glucosamine N-acyltransferase